MYSRSTAGSLGVPWWPEQHLHSGIVRMTREDSKNQGLGLARLGQTHSALLLPNKTIASIFEPESDMSSAEGPHGHI